MDDERLFEMVERCVADAMLALENSEPFIPFAKVLMHDHTHRDIPCTEGTEQACYEALLERLKGEVLMDDIDAVAITARVTIPEQYNAASPQGIRIHIEEKALMDRKLSARLLYIPYDLLETESGGRRSVLLHNPIAVGMPMAVYGS